MSKLGPKEIQIYLRLSSLLQASFKYRFSDFPYQWFPFQFSTLMTHETSHYGFCCGCSFSHEIQAVELFLNPERNWEPNPLKLQNQLIVWEVQDVLMSPILNKIDKRLFTYDLLFSLVHLEDTSIQIIKTDHK